MNILRLSAAGLRRPSCRTALRLLPICTAILLTAQAATASPVPASTAGELLDQPAARFDPHLPRTPGENDHLRAAALFASGLIHAKRQEYDQALADYQRAIQLDPDNGRLRSAVLVSQARIHEIHQRLPEALTAYQRALRWDPQNKSYLPQILQLARHLDRHAETARYSVLLVTENPNDSLEVLRAFIYLHEEDQLPRALTIFEKALQTGQPDLRQPAWIELHKLAGEAYLALDKPRQAADALAVVERVLSEPARFGWDDEMIDLIQGEQPAKLDEMIGRAYLATKQWDKARAAFDRATSEDPGGKWYWTARLQAAADRPQEAARSVQQYIDGKYTSQGSNPYRLLFEVAPAEAGQRIGRLEGWLAQDPKNAPLAYFLSEQYLAAGRRQDARQVIEKQIQRQPKGQAYQNLVRIYHQVKDHKAFLRLTANLPSPFATLPTLGQPLDAACADPAFVDGIVAAARKQLAKPETDLTREQRLAVAILAVKSQRWDVAKNFYSLAAQADPARKAEVYEAWGLDFLAAGRFADAADAFRLAVNEKVLPASTPIFSYYLAGALAADDKFEPAIKAARHAVQASPSEAEYHYRLAWVLYRAGRRSDAIQTYRQLIERFDAERELSATRELVRESRLTLSHLYVQEDDFEAATELLEQVLDEFPEDHGAMNDLGYLWADRGIRLQRAWRMIQAACVAEPDNMAYRDSLGWVHYRLGDHHQALAQLQRAVQLGADRPDGVIYDHLGDVYQALGQAEQARTAWQKAVQAFEHAEDQKALDRVREKLKGE
ncbi:MAG: tetratricopeptide repeat protein [Planctomycetales bacterium]|nr:tetratricopeptide repeat protein [Planctomycetales bacterium]NIN77223.1 tetratricopeptide repeat protein [Planctomycetales bacterium]NIO34405.1 tetratricopeptide repeat protein [Planctomycetales bacterium]NIO46208.1 tetratricopeptide repeat protein [Planctomycetales bacterium]NIP04267.1 tetratricopeptide repeat protein [Planctomycetales bacterium]